ncbi:hypothetical protein, partial [Providencia alcalifaciens]|uniref:hypothetical protein n=1 Tax=Providencia alcalifaciens TaxID=126385 RepID=UPI003D7C41DB
FAYFSAASHHPLKGRIHRYRIITTISYFVWHTSRILNVESALSAKNGTNLPPSMIIATPLFNGAYQLFQHQIQYFQGRYLLKASYCRRHDKNIFFI